MAESRYILGRPVLHDTFYAFGKVRGYFDLATLAVDSAAVASAADNLTLTTSGGGPTNTVLQITGEPAI
jgi:hypothetical protein